MKIRLEREIQSQWTAEDARARALQWAVSQGFRCTSDRLTKWVFERGSLAGSAVSFDLRKHPTTVTIDLDLSRNALHIVYELHSPMALQTPSDESRVREQFDLLVALFAAPTSVSHSG